MHTIKIVQFHEATAALRAVAHFDTNPNAVPGFGLWYGMLFVGDRASCCDEAAVVEVEDGLLVALASIAPNGEQESGEPTIVGLYTLPPFRGHGFGKAALEAAIVRCLERGFTKIRIDALTPGSVKTIQSLSESSLAVLDVHDQSVYGGLLPQ